MTITQYDHKRASTVQRLLRSVAHATDCAQSVFYGPDGAVVASFGSNTLPGLGHGAVQHLCDLINRSTEALLNVEDMRLADKTLASLAWPEHTVFATSVMVRSADGELLGLLLVADDQSRQSLSQAQCYVLRTHAVQLGAQHDCMQVREQLNTLEARDSERLRLLESVVIHANDAILITEAEPIDQPGPRIVYCNIAFTRTTGYSEAEILGKTPRILQGARTCRDTLDRLRTALESWQPIEVELLNQRRDGSEFWVELSIVPVANARGWFTHWISVQRDISERKRAEEIELRARLAQAENMVLEARLLERQRIEQELAWAATHDNLTELYNRAWIMNRLQELMEAEQPYRRRAALLFMDLDRFKLVNDSLGHRAGDHLLKAMARRLESCLRSVDALARVGGDEFVVLIEDQHPDRAAIEVAQRIIESLRKPFRIQGQDIYSSSSIGIVLLSEEYQGPEELLRDADTAMYVAKEEGAGRYAFFTGSMRASVIEALALQNDLKHAIANREFKLSYQPIHDPRTQAIKGVEALLSWYHPQRGQVSPDVFISMAEELGSFREIGRWVMHEACQQLADWRRYYPSVTEHLKMSVNVSARELSHHCFQADIDSALRASGLPAACLQLEINEGVFRHHPEAVGQVLHDIRAMGTSIALDDFGTGYSSLSYIDRYEIDAIKVDRAFVLRMLLHERSMAIMKSLLWLGKALSLDIIAEGVETEEQLHALQDMKCPLAQGYLLSRPMGPEQIQHLLARQAGQSSQVCEATPDYTPGCALQQVAPDPSL